MSEDERWPAEWLRGVLELCVLGAMTEGATHGYALARRIESAGLGPVKGGTLYPLLTRLETDGLVQASWEAGRAGPGRKVFTLTAHGRREAARRAASWLEFTRRAQALLPAPTPQEAS